MPLWIRTLKRGHVGRVDSKGGEKAGNGQERHESGWCNSGFCRLVFRVSAVYSGILRTRCRTDSFYFYFRKVEVFDSRAHATECSILGQREIVDTNRNCFVFGDAWNVRVCYVVVMFTVCFPAVVHLFLSSVGGEIQAKAFGRSHFLSQVPESSDTLGQPAI